MNGKHWNVPIYAGGTEGTRVFRVWRFVLEFSTLAEGFSKALVDVRYIHHPRKVLAMDTSAVTYAGFWKRFLAYIIDGFVLGIVYLLLFIPFFLIIGAGAAMTSDSGFDQGSEASAGIFAALIGGYFLVVFLVVTIAGWLYFALMESSAKGATLGKMALGIRVTDLTGNRISFGRATGRYFAKIISGMILYIGFIMAGFTQQKQALHDIIAGSLVINK